MLYQMTELVFSEGSLRSL